MPSDQFQPDDYYISPEGNDRWSGKLAEPNQGRSDGPFATLAAAQRAIQTLKGAVLSGQSSRAPAGPRGPLTVWPRGGTWRVGERIAFGPEDSVPISCAAYPGEEPANTEVSALPDRNHASDLNLLWDFRAKQLAFVEPDGQARMSFQESKSPGHDRHSIVADPRFRDPRKGGFSLAPDSPAAEIGFEPIDISDVGPRP